jgi:PKD repeat protein
VKKLIFGLLLVIILMGTVACAQESPPITVTPATTSTHDYAASAPGSAWSGNGVPAPVILTQAPPMTITVPAATSAQTKGGESSSSGQSAPVDRMVIRTAYLTLVVDDVSTALAQITSLAAANGGYVVNSNIQEDQNRLYANVSFRVDAKKFNDIIQTLRNMAVDVKSETTSGEDVTSQYVDLTSQLRNLEASEAQLLELMKQAGKVDEILEVQRELTNTRGQIEQIKGQMQYLEQSSDLALINASLEQSKLAVEFNADTRTVKEGKQVQFIPTVSGGFSPYSYEWNFGDGGTSTEAAPTHTYRKDGTFTVTLKIKDDKGNTADSTRTDYITVLPGWSAGNIASGAWNALVGFFRFLASFLIGLAIFSPVWIIILVILYFTVWRRRKNKANKAK